MRFNTWAKILLWIGFIAKVVEIVFMAVLMVSNIDALNMEGIVIFVVGFAVTAVSMVGYGVLLFRYKKSGFYLIAAASVALLIMNIIYGIVTVKVFSRSILTVLVIYYVIRDQWEELE